jgi:hypothetical protein
MSRRTMMVIGAILSFLALIPFLAWPIYKKYTIRAVSPAVYERTKTAVEKNPQLQDDWNKALEDGVLTWPEAKSILEKAGEKAEPDQ